MQLQGLEGSASGAQFERSTPRKVRKRSACDMEILTPSGCAVSHNATQASACLLAWDADADGVCGAASPESSVWVWVCWRCCPTMVCAPAFIMPVVTMSVVA